MKKHTRDLHHIWDVSHSFYRREKRYRTPGNVMLIARDAYDAYVCRRRIVLD